MIKIPNSGSLRGKGEESEGLSPEAAEQLDTQLKVEESTDPNPPPTPTPAEVELSRHVAVVEAMRKGYGTEAMMRRPGTEGTDYKIIGSDLPEEEKPSEEKSYHNPSTSKWEAPPR